MNEKAIIEIDSLMGEIWKVMKEKDVFDQNLHAIYVRLGKIKKLVGGS